MDMVMAHGHCIQIARRKLAWLSSLLIGLSQKQQLPSTTPTPPASTGPKHHTKKKERKKVTTISHREIVGGVKGAVTTSITTAKTNPPNPGTSPLSKQYQRLLHYRNSIDVSVLTKGGGVPNPDTQTPLHYRTDSRCRFSQRGGDPKSRQLRSHNPRLTPVGPETFPLSN